MLVKVLVGIVAGVAIVMVLRGKQSANANVEVVRQEALIKTVSATGTVVSSTDLALSFQQPQTVRTVAVGVGDTVKAGKLLASLSNSTERAALTSANGQLLAARARYKKVLEGATSEEVALAQVALTNAKADRGPETAQQKMYSDGLVAKPEGSVAALNAPIVSGTYRGKEGEYRLSFEVVSNEGRIVRYSGLENGSARVSTSVPQPLGTKGLFITFPATATLGENMQWTISIPNTESPLYATNASAYQAALDKYTAAVATAEAQLAVKRANARQSDVDLALADILTAQAAVDSANAALEKTIIRAPSDGTITKVDVHVGDYAQAQKPVIILQDISNLYLKADVNESNIASVALGQPVEVTYDALDESVVSKATISSIDLSPTVVDGIVNYKINALIADASNIKSGMTANLSVQTAYIADAIVVPERVVTVKDKVATVLVLTDERHNKTESRVVTTGLRGDGGMIQITSGLSAGEKVLFVPAI